MRCSIEPLPTAFANQAGTRCPAGMHFQSCSSQRLAQLGDTPLPFTKIVMSAPTCRGYLLGQPKGMPPMLNAYFPEVAAVLKLPRSPPSGLTGHRNRWNALPLSNPRRILHSLPPMLPDIQAERDRPWLRRTLN